MNYIDKDNIENLTHDFINQLKNGWFKNNFDVEEATVMDEELRKLLNNEEIAEIFTKDLLKNISKQNHLGWNQMTEDNFHIILAIETTKILRDFIERLYIN